MSTRSLGNIGEDIACKFLIKQGFTIVSRNYRKKWGEIDIIARHIGRSDVSRATFHFFEVKSINVWSLDLIDKNLEIYGHNPEENVHSLKTRHIRRMIETYMAEWGDREATWRGHDSIRKNDGWQFQFHILCVYMSAKTHFARVKWMKDIVL